MYVERDIASASLEGQHDFRRFWNMGLDWRFTRSTARRQQPDRRESMYIRVPVDATDPGIWTLATGRREYGDLKDNGWGTHLQSNLPYHLGALGNGKLALGYDRDSKRRIDNYRRFDFSRDTRPIGYAVDASRADPESLYNYVNEATLPQDNYRATQLVEAVFLSTDLPLGKHLRGNLGVRREFGRQDVVSHDLFTPDVITSEGRLSNTDWLGAANLVWSITEAINVRGALSRTVTRPDLDELSSRPSLDYVGDYLRLGNPDLKRGTIENYDLRVEGYPGGNELLAAGVFLKDLHDPIEYTVRGGSSVNILIPDNSKKGRNTGLELEFRASLGRIARSLQRFSVNSNVSFISSKITLRDLPTRKGSTEHPLQGQANHLVNVSLTYQSPGGGVESSVLYSETGRRLVTLSNPGEGGAPDIYDPGTKSLDVTVGFAPRRGTRVKLGGTNLLNTEIREFSGPYLVKSYRTTRSYSIAFSFGS
jgi:TonB-dependent receptor